MRKFLVLFLMVALVPFATGCRIDGLWGYDDDTGTYAPTATTAASIVPTLTLKGVTLTASGTTVDLSNASKVQFVGTNGVVVDGVQDANGNWTPATGVTTTGELTMLVTVNGQVYTLKTTVPAGSLTNGKAVTLVPTSVIVNSDGTTSTTMTVDGTSQTVTSTSTALPTLYVAKVVYAGTTAVPAAEVGLDSVGNTVVDWTAPVFKVYFSTAITAVPTTFSITVNDGTSNVTFSNSTNNLVTMALDSTAKILTLTVNGQSGANQLNPGTLYSAIFNSFQVTATTTGATATTISGLTYKLQTKKTALATWDAQNAAGVSVKSGTTAPVVTTAAAKVLLNFDYAITLNQTNLSAATFKKVVGTNTVTGLYSTYFDNAVLDSTSKILTIPFKTGKTLVAGSYTVTFGAGTLTDKNGKAIDTTTTITFTVQ